MALRVLKTGTVCGSLLAAALCLLAVIPAACGLADSGLLVPTSTPRVFSYAPNIVSTVPPSLEEQMFKSDQVVRASLLSATEGVETVPSGPGVAPTYRAVQELRFTAHEYLKGAGPAEAFIVVRGKRTYLTETEARSAAEAAVSERNTAWDGREGVLFLSTLDPAYRPPEGSGNAERSNVPAFGFTVYHFKAADEWDYSIDTLSRAWLPSSESGGTSGNSTRSSDPGDQTFITDVSTSPPTVISLADLRAEITVFEAMMAAGSGTAGFEKCVGHRIGHERHRRAVPWTPFREDAMLNSGSGAGTEIDRELRNDRFPGYDRFWLTGPSMNLFQTQLEDDDSDPVTGYDQTISTVRPLPAGVNTFKRHWQTYSQIPCNFDDASYRDWTVTVTAPAGTLHEAFFDPVTIGSAVGADGSNGVLEPAGFSVGGTATSISGLKWENGVVTMTLSPSVSLAGHRAEFIGLDGSLVLTLLFDDAQAQGGTLTWTVADKPWGDGDLLMLRIEEILPEVFLEDLDSQVTQGESDSFTLRAAGLSAANSYSIRLSTDNGHLGIGSGCSTVGSTLPVPSGASYSSTLTLTGCIVATGTVTATLLEGTTPVAAAAAEVEVRASTNVTVTLSPREEERFTYTDIAVEWTDPGACIGDYFVAMYNSGGAVYKNLGSHPAPATTSVNAELGLRWDDISSYELTVRVDCSPSDGTGWRILGEVTLQSGLPSSP